ncbi:MAG: four helix bundle protein [Candidatus Omnitrophica bacterium]|nr:four helix bundle protein [Candidatus Omnitrophota bacterium]
MRRSAISIPSNAAEGFRRYHNKEYKQFLYILLGSSAELETQITIAKELGYLTPSKETKLLEMTDHISRMTTNLIKKLNAIRDTHYAIRSPKTSSSNPRLCR